MVSELEAEPHHIHDDRDRLGRHLCRWYDEESTVSLNVVATTHQYAELVRLNDFTSEAALASVAGLEFRLNIDTGSLPDNHLYLSVALYVLLRDHFLQADISAYELGMLLLRRAKLQLLLQ